MVPKYRLASGKAAIYIVALPFQCLHASLQRCSRRSWCPPARLTLHAETGGSYAMQTFRRSSDVATVANIQAEQDANWVSRRTNVHSRRSLRTRLTQFRRGRTPSPRTVAAREWIVQHKAGGRAAEDVDAIFQGWVSNLALSHRQASLTVMYLLRICHTDRHEMVHLPTACCKWRDGLNMRVLFGKRDSR